MSDALARKLRPSVAEETLGRIKSLIRENGSRLPSERALARKLGVSRPSVREALRTLSLMGVVDTRHGSGSQVALSGSNVLRAPVEFLMLLDRPPLQDVHEARELIDVFLAGRAAERRTAGDLEALQSSLEDLKSGMERRAGYVDPDFRFHRALWAAAHHPILERVMASLQEHVRDLIDAVKPDVHDFGPSFDIHRSILDAIRRRSAARARRAMAAHHRMMTDELRNAKLIP